MIEKMQSMLERLVTRGHSCGLRFSPQKTVVVMFTRATRDFTRLVSMEGELLPYNHSVVYLGVTLDKELKWLTHINSKLQTSKQLLNKMANITHSYWGPQPKLMRWMYTGIVRPTMSYASMVWAHQIEDTTIEDKLRSLNRKAINTMVKIPRSTPMRGLEIILDILPLHLHIKKEGLAAYMRMNRSAPLPWEGVFTNITHSVSHLKYWELLTQDVGIQDFHMETDECYVLRPQRHFVVDGTSFVDMDACQGRVDCNVYTDGSKMNGRVGAGIYIHRADQSTLEESFRLPDAATVSQAEMTAVREAASILRSVPDLTTVKFFIDSQATPRTFQADFITSKLALQTITLLNYIPAQNVLVSPQHFPLESIQRYSTRAPIHSHSYTRAPALTHQLVQYTPVNIRKRIRNIHQY